MKGYFKKRTVLSVLLAGVALLSACSDDTKTEKLNEADTKKEITLLYTNDVHAQVEPMVATWEDDQPMMGGMAYYASYINKIREEEENVAYLDAGDLITGPSISTITEGEAIIDLFNYLDVDASVYGNHEFDHGTDQANSFIEQANFPLLAANVFYKDSGEQFAEPYKILDINGVKVGVIGILGKEAAEDTIFKLNVENLEFREQAPIVQQYVDEIEDQVDLVVLLGHEGQAAKQGLKVDKVDVEDKFAKDVEVANEVDGIDVLISGHAHLPIDKPYQADSGTLIVSTRGLGVQVGYLNLEIKDGEIVNYKGHLEDIYSDKIEPDPTVQERIDYWNEQMAELTNEEISNASQQLTRTYEDDSMLGNLSADAMRAVTGADVALQHPGGLRTDVEAGPLTAGEAISVLPFPNSVYTMTLTGEHLLEALEQSAGMKYGILSPSGIIMTVDLSAEVGSRVVEATVNGQAIDPAGKYVVALDAFIALGGDDFSAFTKGTNVVSTDYTGADALIAHLKTLDDASANVEDRVKFVNN